MSAPDVDLHELRERFEAAEAVSRAIRLGEVDAFVVGDGEEDKRVVFLSDAFSPYRRLVEDMPQGAATLTRGGEILFANQAFAALVGVRSGELAGSTIERYVAGVDASNVLDLLASPIAAREADVELRRPDGRVERVRMSTVSASHDFVTLLAAPAGPVSDEEARATVDAIRRGGVDAFVVGEADVVLLDTALAPYRAVVERMPEGAVTVGRDACVVYANERFLATVGLTRDGVAGRPLPSLVDERDRVAFEAMLAGVQDAHAEVRLRCTSGDRPRMLVTMTTIGADRLFLFSDFSIYRRFEASDERTRRFVGMLAHEFRDVLDHLRAATERLRGRQPPAERAATLDAVDAQAKRIASIVTELDRIHATE